MTAVLGGGSAGGDAIDPERVQVLVVTEDMPFLIDSVIAELSRTGLTVHRVVHPVVVVRRDADGSLLEVLPDAGPGDPTSGTLAESWMNLQVEAETPHRGTSAADAIRDLAADLHQRLANVLQDVRAVVEDGATMVERALRLADRVEADPPPVRPHQVTDTVALLR